MVLPKLLSAFTEGRAGGDMPSRYPKDIASMDSDTMIYAAAARQDVDEWKTPHETPSLLFFTRMEEKKNSPEYQKELSDLLTRKFREFFP